MKSNTTILNIVVFLISSIFSPVYGGDESIYYGGKDPGGKTRIDSVRTVNSAIESLSPELRGLLSSEMRAIQQGMMSIIPAYASGNWAEIERIAHQIKNSYILKQSLTDKQRHELHSSLPEFFVEQDQHFHYLSSMLEHAATVKKSELVGFYFSKMSESCTSCHSQFATHRFPAFIPGKETDEHSH